MTTKLSFRLKELGALHTNVRVLFALILLLTAALLSYMGARVFVLSDRVRPLDLGVLSCFAVACLVLCNAQLHCLRRMQGETRVKLENLTFVDELTGVYNYRYLKQRLAEELRRAEEAHAPAALIYLDVDHFKQVNDLLGHHVGDKTLQQIARSLRTSVRSEDFVGRLGGDEFVVVLPYTDRAGADSVAERIKANLDALRLPAGVGPDAEAARGEPSQFARGGQTAELPSAACVSVCVGTAAYPADGTTHEQLLRIADRAMYRAKKDRGKNPQERRPAAGELPPAPRQGPRCLRQPASPEPRGASAEAHLRFAPAFRPEGHAGPRRQHATSYPTRSLPA